MLYERDRRIIKKLESGDALTTGDTEYIIYTIHKCARIEDDMDNINYQRQLKMWEDEAVGRLARLF